MNNSINKGVVVAVILLFVSVCVIPSTGNRVSFDDITPPVTTCTLNPPEPNGENGWYVSDVEVTLNATDDMSGVNVTEYRINGGIIKTYTEPFNVTTDGEHMLEYRSIDYAGNVEDWKSVEFKIDQTKPQIDLQWENPDNTFVIFTADCSDATSGMDYVEFYLNESLMFTDNAAPFEYTIMWSPGLKYAVFTATAFDMAGNSETDDISGGIPYLGPTTTLVKPRQLTFPNNYTGHMGRFFIRATFDYE